MPNFDLRGVFVLALVGAAAVLVGGLGGLGWLIWFVINHVRVV
jgi:hypothetical protein